MYNLGLKIFKFIYKLIYKDDYHDITDCEFTDDDYNRMIYWYEKNNNDDEMWMKCIICNKYSPYYIKEKKDKYEFTFIDMYNYGHTASFVDFDRPHNLDNLEEDLKRQEQREKLKDGNYND